MQSMLVGSCCFVVVVVVFEPQSYQEPLHMHIFPCNPSPTGLPFVSRLHLGLVSIFMSSRKWERWTDGADKEEGRGERERERTVEKQEAEEGLSEGNAAR